MSMFDTIIVKKDLPLPEEVKALKFNWKEHPFQTKDLENCLLNYVIEEDGRLLEHVVEREYVPWTEEEKKTQKISSWDLWKDVIKKGERYDEVNHHGTICFYAYEEFDDQRDFWLNFKAYFVYGKLDKIGLSEFKIERSLKLHNKEMEEKRKEEEKKPWNRFKYYASFLGWKCFWKKASAMCYRLHQIFSSMQRFIIRNML